MVKRNQRSSASRLAKHKLRILLIEDVAQDATMVEHALKKGGFDSALRRVESKAAFLRELKRFQPALILCDHGLHPFDGFTALSLARHKVPEVPFIFVTGSLGEETAVKALKSGATDFVLKQRLHTLPRAVHQALRQAASTLQQRRTEARIKRLNEDLEQRVAARTAELEAANRELEAFSYSVSHDLRAPLRHIDGFVEILQATKADTLDEEARYYLQTVADAAKRMSRLIDDLLTFSRTARAELRKTRIALADLVRAVIRELRPDAQGRDVAWDIRNLPEVEADPALLRQVLLNLLGNALKYTRPRSRARIEIGSQSRKAEHVIFVRDNGVGFDMQYAHKLFSVFQRLHRSADFEGTGIGLANVRRIIHRHGGRTWAEGQPEVGATFFFCLPRTPGKGRQPAR